MLIFSSGRATSISFFLYMVVIAIHQSVRGRIQGNFSFLAQRAETSTGHFGRLPLGIYKNERVGFGSVIEHSPDVGFKLQGFVFKAMIPRQVVPHEVASSRSSLQRENRVLGASDPTAILVNEPVAGFL